ncbi:MAG: hypothetical protein Q7W45_07810, partial [Bacteroidota bacterium]|nr:hypothetical protein [Bacteroidota bacterium]
GASSAEYWMYDSRTGRRFENDPLVYEWQSPYACFNNNPIYYADPLGLEGQSGGNTPKGEGAKKEDGKGKKKKTKEDNKKVSKTKNQTRKGAATKQLDGTIVYHKANTVEGKSTSGNESKPTEKPQEAKKGEPKTDDHKVIGFHKSDKHYSAFMEGVGNTKTNGRKDHFEFFSHGKSTGFQYLKQDGTKDFGYDSKTFDNMMKAHSPDWKKMRATNQKITLTLYGCNMNSHKYKTHDGRMITTKITIAQLISNIPNVTVIAANGYVMYGLKKGGWVVKSVDNYRGDGKFSTVTNSKKITP